VYEAKKAFEQDDAVDARNRLAASELVSVGGTKNSKKSRQSSNGFPVSMPSATRYRPKRKSEYVRWVITLPGSELQDVDRGMPKARSRRFDALAGRGGFDLIGRAWAESRT
jgi:hypothetical protein